MNKQDARRLQPETESHMPRGGQALRLAALMACVRLAAPFGVGVARMRCSRSRALHFASNGCAVGAGHGAPPCAGDMWRAGRTRKVERGALELRAQLGSGGSEFSEEDEESMDFMKERRQLPFDKGASEFVPVDMQPANEWQQLKETFLFDWPMEGTQQFALKLAQSFGFWFVFSLPIAGETWSADTEVLPRLLAALLGGCVPTLLVVLRLLAGVKMVDDRLGQDAVYFESDERRPTTAVDLQRLGYRSQGAMWVKPPEISARDQLIKQFEVAPVLDRLNKAAAALVLVIALGLPLYHQSSAVSFFDPRFQDNQANLDRLRSTSYEDAANREAERLRDRGNKPAYCYSRYYKAVATSDQDQCR